jgi:hypothetical protein
VLCIEQADLQLAPVAIYVEQQHAMQLADFLTGLAAGLEAVTAAAAAAASAAGTDGGTHAGGLGENGRGGASGSDTAGFFSLPASSSLGAVASPATGLPGLSPDLEALLSGRGDAMLAPPEQKVYIDVLRIATLELSITFLPAPFHQGSGVPPLYAGQRGRQHPGWHAGGQQRQRGSRRCLHVVTASSMLASMLIGLLECAPGSQLAHSLCVPILLRQATRACLRCSACCRWLI